MIRPVDVDIDIDVARAAPTESNDDRGRNAIIVEGTICYMD